MATLATAGGIHARSAIIGSSERTRHRRRADRTSPGPAQAEASLREPAAGATLTELGSILDAQERERRRISRELHDVVGQALTAIRLSLVFARGTPDRALLDARLDASIDVVERALVELRTLAHELRPSVLDDLGLLPAVRWYLARQEQVSGLRIVLRPSLAGRLPSEIETAAFRITQEAVTNALRHASASTVEVQLRRRGMALELQIRDDGVGFDVLEILARPGETLGLAGMRERAHLAGGRIEFRSQPCRGTRIWARFPVRGDD